MGTRVQTKKIGRNPCPFPSDQVPVSRARRPGSSGGVRRRKTASWNATETENAERETSSEHSSGRAKEFCKLPVGNETENYPVPDFYTIYQKSVPKIHWFKN